jgi:hypothetical protein
MLSKLMHEHTATGKQNLHVGPKKQDQPTRMEQDWIVYPIVDVLVVATAAANNSDKIII